MNNYSDNSTTANPLGGFAQALRLLEFDQVRQRLAGYARTVLGRERAGDLTPVSDPLEIANRQQETAEACLFLGYRQSQQRAGVWPRR